ncbi:unnamed protein product [Acanthoscelides obtectus]|uniref:DDE Tnp4 domain-containing protein n=1 Tax=Acanthoscelides obtectus TaxID=200917 RepID=A0A9P0LKL0_ACAOB|nr:unnamed protein product [Acanthoscelides obtectus]CAK1679883.1 Putative nuclease HARBI1 [Acanthoscelides obtectus]
MDQTTASRIIAKVSRAIAGLSNRYIRMPNEADEIIRVHNGFYRICRFPRVIVCIDGTHIKMQSPGAQGVEVFRNRKSYFSINTQIVAGPNLKIFDIVARWPGSTHDSTIFNASHLRTLIEGRQFQNAVLLGDSGYQLKVYLTTPLQNPGILTCNVVETVIGVWKRRFPVLAYGSRCRLDTALTTIIATAVLAKYGREYARGFASLSKRTQWSRAGFPNFTRRHSSCTCSECWSRPI